MKIYKTKTGQPYILKADGRAQFIKRSSAKKSRSTPTRTAGNNGGMRTMAKRKKSKGHKRSFAGGLTPMNAAVGGLGYGLVREPINNFVKGLTSNVSLNLGDEVLMGVVDYFVAKNSSGIVKNVALVGLGIEASRIAAGGFNLFGSGSTSANATVSNGAIVIG